MSRTGHLCFNDTVGYDSVMMMKICSKQLRPVCEICETPRDKNGRKTLNYERKSRYKCARE